MTDVAALIAADKATTEAIVPWLQLCGYCDGGLPMNCTCPSGDYRRMLANVAERLSAYIAAIETITALIEEWRYKGEFGWGKWQEGEGPDQEGYVLDQCAADLRRALAALRRADKRGPLVLSTEPTSSSEGEQE